MWATPAEALREGSAAGGVNSCLLSCLVHGRDTGKTASVRCHLRDDQLLGHIPGGWLI